MTQSEYPPALKRKPENKPEKENGNNKPEKGA